MRKKNPLISGVLDALTIRTLISNNGGTVKIRRILNGSAFIHTHLQLLSSRSKYLKIERAQISERLRKTETHSSN